MNLTVGSLFSGIGGLDLGLERAGWEVRWQVEIDPFCRKVLDKHWPAVKKYGDIREVNPDELEPVDLVCGGFPCQDLSVAGKRAGLAGERSRLFYELLRIADSMPSAWVLAENVPGLLSSAEGRDFAAVIGELSGFFPAVPEDGWRNSGVCTGPKGCVAWRVLDAQYFGVAQRRRRVFIVRSPGGAGAAEVLFEPDCVPGNPPPSRQTRTRDGRSFATSPDGSGRPTETSPTLDARANDGPRRNQGGVIVADVCGPLAGASGARGWSVNAENAEEQSPTLKAAPSGSNMVPSVVRWEMVRRTDEGGYRESGEVAPTLSGFMGTGGNNVPMVGVRRLTPTECARLQGFPDDHCRLDNRTPDSPQYRAFGNAVCVYVAEWIGKRIAEVMSHAS